MDFFFAEDNSDGEENKLEVKKPKQRQPTGCWCIDYVPTFETLAISNEILEPFINLVKDKDIPYHINIQGHTGTGKWSVIRSMLWHCFSNNLSNMYKSTECEYVWFSDNIFMTNFAPLTNLESVNTIKFLKNLSKQTGFAGTYKVIILRNIDTLSLSLIHI